MKKTIIIALLVTVGLIVWSLMARSRGENPGIEYAPDMYVSKGYEAYTQVMDDSNVYNRFGSSMRKPVSGTIAVGQEDYIYPFENTADGYAQAASLTMPFIKQDGEGERLYGIYCSMCHGENGGNDGSVFKKDKTMKPGGWDNYQSDYIKNLPVGQIYHVIKYGKNKMGSHAYALTPEERWEVIKHVKYLSNPESTDSDTLEIGNIIVE
jgi:mono/diheme cytochrome c family protein